MATVRKPTAAVVNGTPKKHHHNVNVHVSDMVEFDEKRHMKEIKNDLKHGVVHPALNELEERVNDLGESWETESLFEDALEDLAEDKFFTDGKSLLSWETPFHKHSPSITRFKFPTFRYF